MLFLLTLFIYSFFGYASEYRNIELSPAPQEFSQSMRNLFTKHGFTTFSGLEEFSSIGINQIFFKDQNRSFITVKYDVQGDFKLNEPMILVNGTLLHIKIQSKTVAFFFKDISPSDFSAISEELKRLDLVSLTSKVFHSFVIITQAKAHEDCGVNHPANVLNTTAIGSMAAVGAGAIATGLFSCLQGAKEGATASLDIMSGLRGAKKSLTEFWKSPTKKLNEYYGAVSDTVVGMGNLIYTIGQAMINPSEGIPKLTAKLGEAGRILGTLLQSAALFPPSVAIGVVCSIITGMGIDTLLAAMTGVGSVLLLQKLRKMASVAKMMENLGKLIKKMKLTSLEQLGLSTETLSKLFNKMAAGTLDSRKFDIFTDSLASDSKFARTLATRGLQCSL